MTEGAGLPSIDVPRASSLLRQGRVVAYPTEGVYGLGCDPFNQQAVKILLRLKSRKPEQGLILIASDWQQPDGRLVDLEEEQRQALANDSRPHTTWVVPASSTAPAWLTGKHDSIAIRVSDHPVCQALCRSFGAPLVSTSANPSGQPPAMDAGQLAAYFKDQLAGVVKGELGGRQAPSQIRDLATGSLLRG